MPSWPLIPTPMWAVLIMETSLAPSPIESVTACLYFLTKSTTMAFWRGVTLQQITALPIKKQRNKHLFTAVSKVTKKKQQKIFTLSSDIEEKLLQLWLQSVDQRMAIYDQGVARIAVLVDDAQSWPDGHFLHFTADTGRVSPVAVIGTINILQIMTEN